ncbi:MAG: YajQ family cyclic di-GMP-binding protein [Acidimicrobiia bacterium]
MPSFDVVSQVDLQEVRNAVDQARRELSTRFDFKATDSGVEVSGQEIELTSNTEAKLKSVASVLEEKLVKRRVSLKALSYGKPRESAGSTVRQTATVNVGIADEKAREIVKFVKGLGHKAVQGQIQGDQLRFTAKKRDELQAIIAALRESDFDIPLQFVNFRD